MSFHFKFRLQRLLELREQSVKECQKRVAQAIAAVLDAQSHLHCLQEERQDLYAHWQKFAQGGMSSSTALNYQRCFSKLSHECELAAQKVSASQKNELACRALLDKAMRQQKVLEMLRERNQARFTLEFNRREQAQADEFAMLRQSQESR